MPNSSPRPKNRKLPSPSIEPLRGATSKWLPLVKELWGEERKRLGLMPDGAFQQYANAQTILIATSGSALAGYVLYDVRKDRARLIHLAVRNEHRKHGIGRLLLDELKRRTSGLSHIKLSCRRDYGMTDFWRRSGFECQESKQGRGAKSADLDLWIYWHQQLPILREIARNQDSDKLRIVLDTNVFLDLCDHTRPYHEEACALRDGPLAEDICLLVTPETSADLRKPDSIAQEQQRRQLSLFAEFQSTSTDLEERRRVTVELVARFQPKDTRCESDLKQVAHAIASGSFALATRDEWLLSIADDIAEQHAVLIARPSDIILQRDAAINGKLHQPGRFLSSSWEIRPPEPNTLPELASTFVCHDASERQRDLEDVLRLLAIKPDIARMVVMRDNKTATAILGWASEERRFLVPVLRAQRGRLHPTIAQRLLLIAVEQAVASGRSAVVINDKHLSKDTQALAAAMGFLPHPDGLAKPCPRIIVSSPSDPRLRSAIEIAYRDSAALQEQAETIGLAELERRCWPMKAMGLGRPCYIVPIQATWAARLFDREYSKEAIFGEPLQLALSDEQVYYRAIRNHRDIRAGARVLWYVSQHENYERSGAIRAASEVADVSVMPAKEAYKRNRRFGAYDWQSVLRTADDDPDQPIMVIRFFRTEQLRAPVPLEEATNIITNEGGARTTFPSPVSIPESAFFQLYAKGMQQ